MAAREKVADKNVATTELAAVLGISARRVQQLAQDGILDTVERGKFELGAAVQAYIRFLGRDAMTEEDKKLESAKRKAEATLKLSKAKIAKAQADELSGQMHRSEDVAAMTADLMPLFLRKRQRDRYRDLCREENSLVSLQRNDPQDSEIRYEPPCACRYQKRDENGAPRHHGAGAHFQGYIAVPH